jgi:hypothetical protein
MSDSHTIDAKGLSYGIVAVVRRDALDFRAVGEWLARAVALACQPIGWGAHLPSRRYACLLLEDLGRVGVGKGGLEAMRDIRIEPAPDDPINVGLLGWKVGEVLRVLAEAA